MAKLKGVDVSVFDINSNHFVGVLVNAQIQSSIGDEDGAAINEIDEDPEPVSRTRQITGDAQVDDYPRFMGVIESNNPVVTFSYNTLGATYAGTGLLSQVTHSTRRKALQTESFTIKVKGSPTVTLND